MAKRIKVTVVCSEIGPGLVYQRIRIPFRKLDPNKFDVQITTFSDQFVHYDNETDVFVLLHPSMSEELPLIENLRKLGKKVIVDIDDLLDNLPASHPESDLLQHCKFTVPHILIKANWVVTSTEDLCSKYRHLNANMSVIPNALDTNLIPESYEPKPKHYSRGFTAGWCGGKTHQDDQYEFVFGLERVLTENPAVRAHFKGLMPHRLSSQFGTRCFFDPKMVHYLEYQQWLGTVPWNVCLVGLTDHPFNDAKSDLRFIECARHKIPIIASPRADFVKHIDAGRALGANSNDAFYMQLNWMLSHPEQCQQIANEAHEYVMSHRLDRHAARDWEAVLLGVMEA